MDSNFLVDLDQDHPGFTDATYRSQRDQIARLATEYLRERELNENLHLPVIDYENHQHKLWNHLLHNHSFQIQKVRRKKCL